MERPIKREIGPAFPDRIDQSIGKGEKDHGTSSVEIWRTARNVAGFASFYGPRRPPPAGMRKYKKGVSVFLRKTFIYFYFFQKSFSLFPIIQRRKSLQVRNFCKFQIENRIKFQKYSEGNPRKIVRLFFTIGKIQACRLLVINQWSPVVCL